METSGMASRATQGRAEQETDGPLATQVIRHFPHGILVVDLDGTVLAANRKACSALDEGRGCDLRGMTCCELLGCGSDGPLAGLCITEVATEYGKQLPEMRLDLPSGRSAVWVTAARLGSESQVVLEVRRGDRQDRRQRTVPHWTGGSQLRIAALGRTRLESKEGPMGGAWLEQRAGQILKLLVCERHRVVPAEAIAAILWPRAGRRGVASVRQSVHELRARLEPNRPKRAPSSFVVSRQGGYALDRSRVHIDVDDFERQVAAGLRAFSAGDQASAAKQLRAALQLYEGDLFAEDPYAEWAMEERDRLRDLVVRALRVLGELALHQGKLAPAALYFRRLTEIEPYDLTTQRRLIEVWIREGRHSEAERRYTALRMKMMRDFGRNIDFEFAELLQPESDQLPLG
jgi:DNA-binding SARP family transcriptional activator